MRKPIQIFTSQDPQSLRVPTMYALCDDGTIWARDLDGDTWEQIPGIPQTWVAGDIATLEGRFVRVKGVASNGLIEIEPGDMRKDGFIAKPDGYQAVHPKDLRPWSE